VKEREKERKKERGTKVGKIPVLVTIYDAHGTMYILQCINSIWVDPQQHQQYKLNDSTLKTCRTLRVGTLPHLAKPAKAVSSIIANTVLVAVLAKAKSTLDLRNHRCRQIITSVRPPEEQT
jgi:hypothetical protein